MDNKNRNDRYFRSSSLPLGTFLLAKEQALVGIDITDGCRKEFLFVQTPHLEELVGKYKFGERNDEDALVDARLYEHAHQELLDRVHE